MPNGKRGSKKTAEDLVFNTVVGRNIKYLRKIKNFNQTKVAEHCNVKFQQVQKYEKGKNGCSAFRLSQLAKLFGVGLDVLADPNMITKHRGFTGQDDWLDEINHQIDVDKELDKHSLREEVKEDIDSIKEIEAERIYHNEHNQS